MIALLSWGVWGFFVKLASNYLEWYQIFVLTNIVYALVAMLVYAILKPSIISVHIHSLYYALLAGLIAPLGYIGFYLALESGKLAIVAPLTALYPIVTILLALLILYEKLTLYQYIGIALAVIAIILLHK